MAGWTQGMELNIRNNFNTVQNYCRLLLVDQPIPSSLCMQFKPGQRHIQEEEEEQK